MSIFNIFRKEECPICGKPTNAANKVIAKYNKKNLCQKCANNLNKAGVNLVTLKKNSLEDLQKLAGVRNVVGSKNESTVRNIEPVLSKEIQKNH